MVAEAWGHRRYPASFNSLLTDAMSQANETQSRRDSALDCGYIQPAPRLEFGAAWQGKGGRIANIILKAGEFCRNAR